MIEYPAAAGPPRISVSGGGAAHNRQKYMFVGKDAPSPDPFAKPQLIGTLIVAPSAISIGSAARAQADRILIHSSSVLYIHFATLDRARLAERVENQ
jgi:hypothetical protein